MVEATVVGGIEEIYNAVKVHGHCYSQVSKNIKEIWFSFKFKQVYDRKVHYNSYKDKAAEIIDEILTNNVIDLNRKAINISGNLDAQKIRNICSEHGISFVVPPESNGGVKIGEIMDKRNNLAHGGVSFVECGRDYAISDLLKIAFEVEMYLTGLLNGMKDYYNNRKWILSN